MLYTSPLAGQIAAAARKAGSAMGRDFGEIEKLQSSQKGVREFVANAYRKAAAALDDELARIPNKGGQWLAAPLDGIMNFAHGVPHFSLAVALCDAAAGAPQIAVVYNPVSDELFFAEKGQGAFREGARNSERLRVSARKDLKEALVAASPAYYAEIVGKTDGVRAMGSASLDLAYLAAGKFDAALLSGLEPGEAAAGALLVKEAGGRAYAEGQKDTRSENIVAVINSGGIMALNAGIDVAAL